MVRKVTPKRSASTSAVTPVRRPRRYSARANSRSVRRMAGQTDIALTDAPILTRQPARKLAETGRGAPSADADVAHGPAANRPGGGFGLVYPHVGQLPPALAPGQPVGARLDALRRPGG